MYNVKAVRKRTIVDENKIGQKINMTSAKIKVMLTEQVSSLGLTGVQAAILKYIAENSQNGKVYAKDIEQEFNKQKSTVAGIISLLEQNGLLNKESIDTDCRYKNLTLTPKASNILVSINEKIAYVDKTLLKGVSEEEYQNLMMTLDKILQNFKEREK